MAAGIEWNLVLAGVAYVTLPILARGTVHGSGSDGDGDGRRSGVDRDSAVDGPAPGQQTPEPTLVTRRGRDAVAAVREPGPTSPSGIS